MLRAVLFWILAAAACYVFAEWRLNSATRTVTGPPSCRSVPSAGITCVV